MDRVNLPFSETERISTRARSSSSECREASTSSATTAHTQEVSQSFFELDKPPGNPSMQLLFFHGLQFTGCTNTHLSTWESRHGSCIWPQQWLAKEFPGAHVLYVSYEGHVGGPYHGSVFDMNIISENFISDLMQTNIGQVPGCPVILVGHSVGGLVMKQVCCQAHDQLSLSEGIKRDKLKAFLHNLRGMFFYGTPHEGSAIAEEDKHLCGGPLLDYFQIHSKETARLNDRFDKLFRSMYPNWRMAGVGESNRTKWGTLGEYFIVPEASARRYDFNLVDETDHFTITKPETISTRSFYKLKEFLSTIANDVKDERKPQVLGVQYVPKHVVGVKLPVQEIRQLLLNFSTVGLVGMGGLGKTTLAKVVFNALYPDFEYTCFVEDAKLKKGNVHDIKNEVWKLMYCDGKKVGGEMEWSRLTGKRLLLVLDDISEDGRDERFLSEISDTLAPESRFIVTSREEDLVRSLGEIYRVPCQGDDMALEIFNSHAFPDSEAPRFLKSHIKSIVEKCEGLPLALEVLGKYLRGKTDERHWEGTLKALVEAEVPTNDLRPLNKRLWAKLRPSYDDLGKQAQQMFLDATTFFSDDSFISEPSFFIDNTSWTLGEAKLAWRAAYGKDVEFRQWQTLVDMSLVYNVADNEVIRVHEQLRGLGRKIAYEEGNYGNWRVWDGKEGFKMLNSMDMLDKKELYSLRVEYPSADEDEEPEDSEEESGSNESEHEEPEGSEEESGSNESEHEESDESASEVEEGIDTASTVHESEHEDNESEDGDSESDDEEIGKTWEAKRIKKLCKTHSPMDITSSTLHKLKKLHFLEVNARLNIVGPKEDGSFPTQLVLLKCVGQTLFDPARQKRLAILHITDLECLPDSVKLLSYLEKLTIRSSPKLCSLPESFGKLSCLTHLEFEGTSLRALPESFGELKALQHLSFRSCSIDSLPRSFSKLKALQYLSFVRCPLKSLPDSFGRLGALQYLYFQRCPLKSLPDSFGRLGALRNLVFHTCDIHSLPESFGQLSSLDRLQIQSCHKLRALPDSFGALSSLTFLHFRRCRRLHTLPDSFGTLSSLTHLLFYECPQLLTLPESFGKLSSLKFLEFSSCDELQSLPESIGDLSSLSHLQLEDCEQLHTLPDSFGNLSSLKFIHRVCGCELAF